MKNYTLLNDTHVGTLRMGGTTPRSSFALRQFALDNVASIFEDTDNDVIVNGDLFDGYSAPLSDVLAVYNTVTKWLERGNRLFLLPGNHDLSGDSSKLSSFEFLAQLLLPLKGVSYLRGGGWIDEADGVYGISHVPNQDLFDLELSRVPACKYLLLHCNWDNGFAREMDHSLNLCAKVAEDLPAENIILAHEHNSGSHMNGRVEMTGNPFPTSIADCLAKNSKHVVTIGDAGKTYRKTWDKRNYVEVDWKDVTGIDAQFIRVIGTASAEEAAQAVDVVARLRRGSEAFVVGSAVKTLADDSLIDMTDILSSVESVKAFDVMAEIKSRLSVEQIAVIDKLK